MLGVAVGVATEGDTQKVGRCYALSQGGVRWEVGFRSNVGIGS